MSMFYLYLRNSTRLRTSAPLSRNTESISEVALAVGPPISSLDHAPQRGREVGHASGRVEPRDVHAELEDFRATAHRARCRVPLGFANPLFEKQNIYVLGYSRS